MVNNYLSANAKEVVKKNWDKIQRINKSMPRVKKNPNAEIFNNGSCRATNKKEFFKEYYKQEIKMQSEFQQKFQTMFQELGEAAKLRGDILLIEMVEEPEVTIGNTKLILGFDNSQVGGGLEQHKSKVGIVIGVGDGYFVGHDKPNVKIEIPVGAIVKVPEYSGSDLSTFPGLGSSCKNKLRMVKENEVEFVYKDLDTYNKARELLNE